MIRSFASKDAERLFNRQFVRALPHDLQRKMRVKLELLAAAERLEDLRMPPGNRLERLSGDREGQYSIRVNEQWRICFEWHHNEAYNVEIVDYH
jgi:proteic killer suppression protein